MNRTFLAVILIGVAAVCGYAQKVDNSLLIPGMTVVTQEQDLVAMAAISALTTQSFARVYDSAQPSRYFTQTVNGTGTVYEVTGPFTNLMVTLSADFEETATHSRPAWTNNVFPFTDGYWTGEIEGDHYRIAADTLGAMWSSVDMSVPSALNPFYYEYSQGTATVTIASVYYATNAVSRFTTEAELEAAKAACGVVLTNTVNAATNALMPYSRTVYGDVTTTNEAGYAAFNATNAAVASYSALIPSSSVGSFTNIFRYNFNGVRKFGTLTNTAWFVKSVFGAGYKAVSTVVSVKDAAGNVLASSASQPVNIDQTVTTPAAITNMLAIPLNIYSGTVEIACIAVSTNASFSVRLYTGGQYASSLSFGEAPIPYATASEVSGLKLGATNITDGVTSGTYDDATRTFNISAIAKKITKPILSSSTNVIVTSTNAVYDVAATGTGTIGIDWSGLSLDGTKRAEVLMRMNVSEWGGTNVTFSPSLTFDTTPEILVTGVWEFVCSTIDGTTTRVRQTWPEVREWRTLKYMGGGQFDAFYGFWNFDSLATTNSIAFYNEFGLVHILIKSVFRRTGNEGTGTFALAQANRIDMAFNAADIEDTVFVAPGEGFTYETMMTAISFQDVDKIGFKLWILGSPETVYVGQVPYSLNQYRKLNANERAAYDAGWRP